MIVLGKLAKPSVRKAPVRAFRYIKKYFQEKMEQHIKKTKCKRHPQKSECLNCPYGVYVRFQNNFLVLYSVNFTMDIFSNCNINIIADVVRIQKQVAVITFTYL